MGCTIQKEKKQTTKDFIADVKKLAVKLRTRNESVRTKSGEGEF
jgi:hypothetical protein